MNKNIKKNTVLIVEDDQGIRKIIGDYLRVEGTNVVEAGNGIEAMNQFNSHDIDLVVLDINLPLKDGIEVCTEIREKSGVPIIMVTARTKESDELLGLNIGADDYVKKPFSPKVLMARIKALLRRPESVEKGIKEISVNGITIYPEKQEVLRDGEKLELTTVQFNLLLTLVENRGKVMTREALLDSGYTGAISNDVFDRTIDSHIKNIRKAIGDDARKPELIETVRGKGYKFTE